MKFKRSTFLTVLLATVLAGGVLVLEVSQENREEQQATEAQNGNLFPFEEKDIVTVEVQRPDVTLSFRKRSEPVAGEADWLMEKPDSEPASDGAMAYLLNLLATESATENIEVEGDRRTEFGFDSPTGIVTVSLADQRKHVFVLGAPNFNSSGFYALIDTPPNAETLSIKLVSAAFAPAIARPLEEWKATAEAPLTEPSSENSTPGSESEPSESEPPESEPPESDLPASATPSTEDPPSANTTPDSKSPETGAESSPES